MKFKRSMLFVLALLMVLTLLPMTSFAYSNRVGIISASAANIRSKASVDGSIVGKVEKGTSVTVIKSVGMWFNVSVNGVTGYIRDDCMYVTDKTASTGSSSDSSSSPTVNANGVNFRSGASLSSSVIGSFNKGTVVSVQSQSGDWYKVTYNGTTGYVYSQYVSNAGNVASETGSTTLPGTLKLGMRSNDVAKAQTALKEKGYFKVNVTGLFGTITLDAVKRFQRDAGLVVDGLVGNQTKNMLYNSNITANSGSGNSGNSGNSGSSDSNSGGSTSVVSNGNVVKVDWFAGGNEMFPYTTVTVIDVRTGISYNVKRCGGQYHADVEPVTAEDTEKMYQTYGRQWSWDRRPVWVVINGTYVAASINGMPHGKDTISTNGMSGQVCIHFLNSKTHGGNAVCPLHQACVNEAFNAG